MASETVYETVRVFQTNNNTHLRIVGVTVWDYVTVSIINRSVFRLWLYTVCES